MIADNIPEALRRMRRYGFELRITSSTAAASRNERQKYAVQASASVLYNVGVEAFEDGGNWEPVARHVMENGLREMHKVDARELDLNLGVVELAAVNAAIAFASELLELAEAAPS